MRAPQPTRFPPLNQLPNTPFKIDDPSGIMQDAATTTVDGIPAKSLIGMTKVVQTPGFEEKQRWVMLCRNANITLHDPNDPITRTA
jgi:hypothetical protein